MTYDVSASFDSVLRKRHCWNEAVLLIRPKSGTILIPVDMRKFGAKKASRFVTAEINRKVMDVLNRHAAEIEAEIEELFEKSVATIPGRWNSGLWPTPEF